jgi:hypothetical protein
MFDLTKIKIKYVNFDFQTSYLVKLNTLLRCMHIWHLVGFFKLTNVINVIKIKINHINMIDYNYNVTFNDVEIFKYFLHFKTKLLRQMKIGYGCHFINFL